VYPGDERFKNDFENKTVSKAKLARYLLAHLADKMQPTKSLEVIQDEQRVTLEHIMPKSPSGHWTRAAPSEKEYLAFVDRIGNLTLLERKVNGAAGNAPFSEKVTKAFAKSDLVLTQEICKYSSWTTSQIADRQRRLAETAAEVWSIRL
jgi:hypothetical protein